MDSIFVSYSFSPQGRALAELVKGIVRTYGIRPLDGEAVGGGALNDAIRAEIKSTDGLVGVLTPRQPDPAPGGVVDLTPSQYVLDEINYARAIDMPTIGLVAPQTQVPQGLWTENERIELAADEKAAILKLCRSVGRWRAEGGRLVRVVISPEQLAQQLAAGNGNTRCSFRATRNGKVVRDWVDVSVIPEIGGVCAYLSGVTDDALLQLRVDIGNERWESSAHPQWVHVNLNKRN
jgi:hypothetical protein